MFGGTIGRPVGQKNSQKIYFLLIFVQSMCQKRIKKSLVAISKGYVWWHNRAAGWAKIFSKNIFFVNFCSVYVAKRNKEKFGGNFKRICLVAQ